MSTPKTPQLVNVAAASSSGDDSVPIVSPRTGSSFKPIKIETQDPESSRDVYFLISFLDVKLCRPLGVGDIRRPSNRAVDFPLFWSHVVSL